MEAALQDLGMDRVSSLYLSLPVALLWFYHACVSSLCICVTRYGTAVRLRLLLYIAESRNQLEGMDIGCRQTKSIHRELPC